MSRAWRDQTLLERMVTAVQRVRRRLIRATAALEASGIPYAVVGSSAVAAWVATVDPSAVRNTQDVDILVRRPDLAAAECSLEAAGFARKVGGEGDLFLDGPDAGPRDAVRLLIAEERVRPEHTMSAPDVTGWVNAGVFRVLPLQPVVQMALTAFRRTDRVDLRDMIDVDLIDATWPGRFSPDLAARLQSLIDTPEG